MDLKNRKVLQFRTQIDPMIGPLAKNAFNLSTLPGWEFHLCAAGVYVKAVHQVPGNQAQISEHIVPFANIQSIKLASSEKE